VAPVSGAVAVTGASAFAAAGGDSTRRPHGHVLHYQLHAGEKDSGSTSNWAFLAGLDTQFPFASRREEEGPVVAGVINNDDLPLLVVVARLLQGKVRMLLRDVFSSNQQPPL
jgi:hypothetical protein